MARSATKSKGAMAGQLRLEVEHARVRADASRPAPAPPAPPPEEPEPEARSVYADEAPATPFCAWLLKQKGASGFVGGLATAAAGDRTFPRDGDVEAARKWLQRLGASGDDWEALEDAESAWLAS